MISKKSDKTLTKAKSLVDHNKTQVVQNSTNTKNQTNVLKIPELKSVQIKKSDGKNAPK